MVGQAKLHKAEFMLANDIKTPEAVRHVTCKEEEARQSGKHAPVKATGWVCSARKGRAVHRNCGSILAGQEAEAG